MTKYFISGSLDLEYNDFLKYYESKINEAIKNKNNSFVIGDSRGVDTFAQQFLSDKNFYNVVIYHIGLKPLNLISENFKTKGNFKNHNSKDSDMTKNSDIDILYIRSIEEQKTIYGNDYKFRISGTEKNFIRRTSLLF
jgi:hypothetical protein